MKVVRFPGLKELAELTAPYLNCSTVAISVGSTYSQLFPYWLELHPQLIQTEFFPVDERVVPFEAPQSNWGTAYRQFLKPAGRAVDRNKWPQSSDDYCRILKERFGKGLPKFDSIFLGVGNDGHTASLFPGYTLTDSTTAAAIQTQSPIPPVDRITLAPTVLARCSNLVVVLSGKGKEKIARRVIDSDDSLPIVQICRSHPSPILFISNELA